MLLLGCRESTRPSSLLDALTWLNFGAFEGQELEHEAEMRVFSKSCAQLVILRVEIWEGSASALSAHIAG